MFDKHLDLFDRYLQVIGFEHVGCGVEPRAYHSLRFPRPIFHTERYGPHPSLLGQCRPQ